jgi:molybdopterin molybdotransferase
LATLTVTDGPELPLVGGRVDDARALMCRQVSPLGDEVIDTHLANGRVLRGHVTAKRDQPPFAASAMDGYAVIASEVARTLRVMGESRAGQGWDGVFGAGDAVRIFTGAPLPEGADAVVMQEDVGREGDDITCPPAASLQNVRPRGVDFVSGTRLLAAGQRLDPIDISLAAAAGEETLTVARRPRITLLAGGDEIVALGGTPGPWQIFDSITPGLSALLEGWGADVRVLAPERDDADKLASAFEAAFSDSDLVITIGGASVGDHDLMKPALVRFEPEMIVDKVAVRPGKPVWFAKTGRGPVLGLPGNPASALVCAHLFARPLLSAMTGDLAGADPTFVKAALMEDLPKNGPREHYLRAWVEPSIDGGNVVTPSETQDSSLLSVFARSNALVRLQPNEAALARGNMVDVLRLR